MTAALGTAEVRLLEEAAAWRLCGLLLERPRGGWAEEVAALGRACRDDDLRGAAEAAREATESAYLALLGPGGAVSPREVAYVPDDPGRLLADVAAFHAAFAFRSRPEDPIDHAAVEAGLVGYLKTKEAYARAAGDSEAAGVAAEAVARFLDAHLGRFAAPFAERLDAAGAPAWLAAAARALAARALGAKT